MARTLAFVPSQAAPGGSTFDLDVIPDEVKQEIEAVYTALKKNPAGRMRVTCEDKTEALQYAAMAAAYCAQRPAGALRFRKSPTKGLPENQLDFRVTDLAADNGSEAIRDAANAANAANATPAPADEPAKAPKRR